MTNRRPLVVDDLARLRWAMEPALHPDGEAVAYVISGPDSARDGLGYELHVAGAAIATAARRPKWSPDGARLAFVRQSGGSGWQLAWREETGDIHAAPSVPGDIVAFDWHAAGEQVVCAVAPPPVVEHRSEPAFVTNLAAPPPAGQLWLIPLTAGVPQRLVDSDGGHAWSPTWSHDGTKIAYLSDRGVDRDMSTAVRLWCADVVTGRHRVLVAAETAVRTSAWSPDDRRVAYLATARDRSASAHQELWVLDLDGGSRRLAPDLDRSIGQAIRGDDERAIGPPQLAWTDDGAAVLAVVADGGRSSLMRFGLDGGWDTVVEGDRCILEFSAAAGGAVAFSWSDPATPGEVTVAGSAGPERRVSTAGDELAREVEIFPTRAVSVTASDGVEVEGWVTADPAAAAPRPLVLQVHGGPHYAVGERFSFDSQRLAAHGWAVLRANPRGSHGRGAAYAAGNRGDWGGRDYADLMDLVDGVSAAGDVDADRVAIIGESYGGYMAAWAITQTGRFAAAAAESTITDFVSATAGVSGPTFWFDELGGAPWENPAVYLERSVIFHVDRVHTPLLLIHCEGDTTCPIAHSEALFTALRTLGRDVTFLRIPGESHFFNVFGALQRRLRRTAALDEFLLRHLGSRTASPTREEAAS